MGAQAVYFKGQQYDLLARLELYTSHANASQSAQLSIHLANPHLAADLDLKVGSFQVCQ